MNISGNGACGVIHIDSGSCVLQNLECFTMKSIVRLKEKRSIIIFRQQEIKNP